MACDYKKTMKDEQFVHLVPCTHIMIGWTTSKEGWVKINTYGARTEDSYAGCGGFIRGCDKEWLGGFSKQLGQCSAYVAKLCRIFEGLKLARRPGFHKVEVCFDSRDIYNNIINGMNGNVMGGSLVQRIGQLMDLDWEVKMRHIYREENYCVDGLGNLAFDLATEFVFFDTCPEPIRECFLADVSGVVTPRLVCL